MKSKLVSRNPVQRFKLGKQILFAQNGLGRWFYNGKEVFSDDGGKTFKLNESGRLTGAPGAVKNLVRADKVGKGAYKVGNSWYKIGGNGRPAIVQNSAPSSQKTYEGRVLPDTGQNRSKKIYPSIKQTSTSNFFGTKAGGTVNRDALSQITADQRAKLIGTGNFTDADFTNVKSLQGALNRYFSNDGAGSIKEDNLWGDQTQKAFNMALSKADVPVLGGSSPIQKVTPTIEAPAAVDYKPVYNTYNLNRSQTRDLMRAAGYNPYSFSGGQRKALRLYLNGESNDTSNLGGIDLTKFNINPYEETSTKKWTPQGQDWKSNLQNVLSLSYRKKGGTLSSRNPITRFKANFRLVAQ